MTKQKTSSSGQKKSARANAVFYVNGVRQEIKGGDHFLMLANWLRRERELTGTKIVCAEGDCGACTVQQSYPADKNAKTFQAVNSCIKLVGQMDGTSIVTIEGIQAGEIPSPVQEAMKSCHGSQCGYCTPGFVMAMAGVIEERKEQLSVKQAMNCLTGNLCRCTGYQPIIDAATTAIYSEQHSLEKRYLTKSIQTDLSKAVAKSLLVEDEGKIFFAPATLKEALKFLNQYKNKTVRIVNSSTDLGVQYNKGKPIPELILSVHLIPELQKISKASGRISVGARVTLTTLRDFILPTHAEFAGLLNVFASPQIKNTATLVGNVANASPIGDTMPFLMVADAVVHTASLKGSTVTRRKIPLTEFYLGYKKLALKPNELITDVSFSLGDKNEVLKIYKVAARKDLDISAVCGAFAFKLKSGKTQLIDEARIAFGGVAATTIRCFDTEELLNGKPLSQNLLAEAAEHLNRSIKPLDDLRGSAAYRHVLAKNMLTRYGEELLATKGISP